MEKMNLKSTAEIIFYVLDRKLITDSSSADRCTASHRRPAACRQFAYSAIG